MEGHAGRGVNKDSEVRGRIVLAELHGILLSLVVFTTGALAGVGLVTPTLAKGFVTDWVGTLQMVVPVHHEDVETVAAAHVTSRHLCWHFHSVFVFDRCRL